MEYRGTAIAEQTEPSCATPFSVVLTSEEPLSWAQLGGESRVATLSAKSRPSGRAWCPRTDYHPISKRRGAALRVRVSHQFSLHFATTMRVLREGRPSLGGRS